MRFSFLNVLKSSAPPIFLVLALPLVAEQQDPAQLTLAPTSPVTLKTTPSAGQQRNNRLEGYFALAGFALVTVLCRKR
jgi:hypothetical protein